MNNHGRETILAIHALTRKSLTTNYRELAAKLGISVAAIQERLKYVEGLGLVPPRPKGQRNTVRLDPSVVVHKKQVYQLTRVQESS